MCECVEPWPPPWSWPCVGMLYTSPILHIHSFMSLLQSALQWIKLIMLVACRLSPERHLLTSLMYIYTHYIILIMYSRVTFTKTTVWLHHSRPSELQIPKLITIEFIQYAYLGIFSCGFTSSNWKYTKSDAVLTMLWFYKVLYSRATNI